MRGLRQTLGRPGSAHHDQTSGTIMKIKSGLAMAMMLPFAFATPAQAQNGAGAGSSSAHGAAGKVIIRGVEMRKDGAIFESSEPDQAQPSCVKRPKWSVSLKTKQQQVLFGKLFAAASMGVPISVQGTGKCLSVKGAETISSVDGMEDADALTSTTFNTNGSGG